MTKQNNVGCWSLGGISMNNRHFDIKNMKREYDKGRLEAYKEMKDFAQRELKVCLERKDNTIEIIIFLDEIIRQIELLGGGKE